MHDKFIKQKEVVTKKRKHASNEGKSITKPRNKSLNFNLAITVYNFPVLAKLTLQISQALLNISNMPKRTL